MQIIELVLYGNKGQKRSLPFQTGSVSIITGKSKTGKSAVGDIIEYCLGGKDCNIAEGVVRDNVAWYGLLLQIGREQMFVARKNPDKGKQSTNYCYYEVGTDISTPETLSFSPNTNIDGIERLLADKLGIAENIHNPEEYESRRPLEANFRHTLFYCIQRQDEVAARSILFHRQNESFITQAIKDTLPYFLGAVDEETISLMTERREKDRLCRVLKKQLSEQRMLADNGSEKAISLLGEAASVGLIDHIGDLNGADFNTLRATLSQISLVTENPNPEEMDLLSSLQEKHKQQLNELRELQETIRDAEGYLIDVSGYNTEVGYQKQRLESIGLFEKITFDSGKCPLCGGTMEQQLPNVEMMKNSIIALDQALSRVSKEKPKLLRIIDEYKQQETEKKRELAATKAQIEGVYSQLEDADRIHNINYRRSKVIGRISYWLENVREFGNTTALENRIHILEQRIEEIDGRLSKDSISDKIKSALSIIQTDMTEWAKELGLEDAGKPYRLDYGKATVVVDKDRPIPLNQMGSGSNWLGAHLITLFALHKYFIENNRPVPSFLFMDQPSQVYFPEGIKDEDDQDIIEVRKIYSFIHRTVSNLAGKMQVIIVDHAKLDVDEFRNDTVEEWRDDQHFLVPPEWYQQSTPAEDV